MDQKLLASLEYLAQVGAPYWKEASLTLEQDIHNVRQKLTHSPQLRLPPQVYSAHWHLYQSLKRGDSDGAEQGYAALQTIPLADAGTQVLPFPSLNSHDLYDQLLVKTLTNQHTEAYGAFAPSTPPGEDDFVASKHCILEILEKIREVDPPTIDELAHHVPTIYLIKSDEIDAGSSFTSFGCMYIHVLKPEQNWTAYLEHIVHEAAHLHLFAVISKSPIFEREGDSRYLSPLREEPRPLSAIFHQLFVLYRVIRVIELFQRMYPKNSDLRRINTSYKNYKAGKTFEEKFMVAAQVLKEHAQFTELGRALFENCCRSVEASSLRYE